MDVSQTKHQLVGNGQRVHPTLHLAYVALKAYTNPKFNVYRLYTGESLMQLEMEMDPAEGSLTARANQRVHWRTVIRSQDWASITATTLIIIPLAVTSYYTHVKDRSFVVYDGSLSLPYYQNSTIPVWVAVLVPSISMLVSLVGIELMGAPTRNVSSTWAVASVLHFVIDFVSVFIVNGTLTETTKLMVGRFRPDWLARCAPTVPSSGVTPTYGLPASDNPACHSSLGASKLLDGHKSFPSGHSSTAFSLGMYCAIYVLWATYHRGTYAGSRKQYGRMEERSWRERLLMGIGSLIAFLWAFFQFCWAW